MTKHKTLCEILEVGLKAYQGKPSEPQARAAVANLCRHIGRTRLTRFRADTVKRYRKARVRDNVSAATRNREVGTLRAILRRFQDAGCKMTLPNSWGHEQERERCRVLDRDEAAKLVGALDDLDWWSGQVVRLLLGTGARVGEILGARKDQISLDVDGGWLLLPSPKEGLPKALPLRNGALRAARALSERTAVDRTFGNGDSEKADYDRLRQKMQRACKAAGVAPVTPHDLRRTFASWALRAGADLESVADALGHRSVQTTRRYARVAGASRKKVADLATAGFDV